MKVEASIQKWGNGLALRVSGLMRDIPHFTEGTKVTVDITEDGFTVKKIKTIDKKFSPFTEKQLLADIDAHKVHADEVAPLRSNELGE